MSKCNIVHIEIPAASGAQAGQFYKDLFDWKISREESMDYTLWEPEIPPGGGFTPLGEDLKPGDILLYVDSPDIGADLKRAVKLGGTKVTEKTEIPGVGWFAIFKDPTGNRMALFTSKDPEYKK